MKKNNFFFLSIFIFVLGLLVLPSKVLYADALGDIETAILQGDYKKAGDLSNAYLAKNPLASEKNQAIYFLGLSELYQKNYGQARATFERLLAAKPDVHLGDKAELGIIDSIYMAGDYKGARQRTEDLLKRRPDSEFLSLIYLKMARENLKLTNWAEAKKYLNKIIGDFPNSVEFHTAKQLLEEKQYFAVQVGSFLEQARAEQLAQELKQKGEYAYIVETTDKQARKFYRVRIGQFSDLENAESMEQKLSSLGYPTRIYP